MPPLLFPLPTTSLLTFSSLLHDPTSSYTTGLADATAARTKLHLALKAASNGESVSLSVVDAVQGYLPYLRGIIACLDSDELLYKGEPVFQWRSPLTQYSISSPVLALPSIHSEHLFVLLTYTLALSGYAHAILAALPSFEVSPGTGSKPHISAEDEKKTTAGLTRAVDLLCQAAGIAEWTAENVVPLVDAVRAASGGRAGKNRWPVETGAEAFRGLAMTLLADAHVTAIRKLLLPVLPHALFAPPGPPLPSSHPSPALLAKLYLHVASLYTSARALFKVHQAEPSSGRKLFKPDRDELESMEVDITISLKRYLRKESLLASALALKWLGVDAGENGKGARVGEAVAWVREAKSKLEELEDGALKEKMKGLGMGKANERKKEERRARKGRVERELDDLAAWSRSYSRLNETVSFQPVPPFSSLNIPSGRPIFASKPFKPPASKLGSHQETTSGDTDEYAGRGNYY